MKERVRRTVDFQTSPKQPDSITREQLRLHLCRHADCPQTAVDEAVEELLSEADGGLVETDDGRLRVAADS